MMKHMTYGLWMVNSKLIFLPTFCIDDSGGFMNFLKPGGACLKKGIEDSENSGKVDLKGGLKKLRGCSDSG